MLSSGFIRRHSRTFAALAFLFAYSVGISFATPPVSPYQPGTTLQPSCLPGSTNCTTQILPSQSGNTNRILSTDGTNTTWTNTLTGVSLSGSTNTLTNIPNSALTNNTITINGSAIALGGSVSNLALVTNPLSQFASTTSAQLASTISDETGSGTLVYATSPTLTTVGINTAPTASPLTVGGDIRIATGSGGQIVFADGSTMSSAGLGSAAALSNTTDAIVTGDSDANSSGDIILKTGSNDRLHILNSGNVGINTATPSTRFVVRDGTTEIQMHTDANNAFIDSTGGIALSAGGTNKNTYIRASGTGYIAINDTTAGIVSLATGGGNVGVGTGSPSALFSVGSLSPFQVTNTGAVTALSYAKTGGTSSQFLKADGSVDSSTYLTTGSAASTYLPLTAGVSTPLTGDLYFNKASPLIRFAGTGITSSNIYASGSTLNFSDNGSTKGFYIDVSTGALTQLGSGAFTWGGSVTGSAASFTTGTFNGAFVNSSTTPAVFSNSGASNYNYIELRGGTVGSAVNWALQKDNTTANAFQITPSTVNGGSTYSTPVLTITSTGNLTTTGGYSGTTGTFGSTAAATGNVRLPFDNAIRWRNAGNTADLGFYLGSSNTFFTDAPLNVTGNLTVNNGSNSYIYGQTTNSYIRLDNTIGSQIGYASYGTVTLDSNGATIANANGTALTLNYSAYPTDVYSASGYKSLIAGGFTLMYRNDRDSYIGSNTQYNSVGTYKAIYSTADGSGMLSMVGGDLNWLTYNGSVTGGSTYALTSKFSISKDGNSNFTGSVAVGSMLTVNIPDISTGENKGVQLNNTGGGGKAWNITAGRTGANNGDFVIRNSTDHFNAVSFDGASGAASFSSSLSAASYGANKQGSNSVGVGPYNAWYDGVANRQFVWQMDASNNMFMAFYNGSGYSTISTLSQGGVPSFIGIANCNPIKADSAGVLNCSSDERLKDISGQYVDGLLAIKTINPILYTWKSDSGLISDHTILGFSAQNVQAVIPQAITTDVKGNLQLSTDAILAAAVNAIKELDIKVQDISSLDIQNQHSLATLITQFLADAANGIGKIFSNTIATNNIEMKDSATGQVYCVRIINGQFDKVAGSCDAPAPVVPTPPPTSGSDLPQPTCSDGIQNQDETAVDTGGVCASVDPSPDASIPPPTDVPPPDESPATV